MDGAEKAQLLMLKGVLSELPQEQQNEVRDDAAFLRGWIAQNKDIRIMALALVGMEIQAE